MRIPVAGVAGTVLVVIAAVVCVRLGLWQLDRLDQRRARNALVTERLALPPVELTGTDGDPAELAFRRTLLRGEWDEDRTIVLAGRAHQGSPGVHVLTPLLLEGGHGGILVNRGWVPAPDAATVDLSVLHEPGTVRVEGLAMAFPEYGSPRQPDGGDRPGSDRSGTADRADDDAVAFRRVWFRPDGAAILAQSPYPLAPFYVQALPDGGPARYPVRLPPPELDDGPHLGYALQWFSFGLIAVVGWVVLALRRGGFTRRPSSSGRDCSPRSAR